MIFPHKKSSGFSFVEVLIATVLLGIALVPAMNALRTGVKATEIHQNTSEQHYYLMSQMETVLVESFSSLDAAAGASTTPSSYSDAAENYNVYLSRYDADNADADDDVFTGTDNIIWVRTELIDSGLAFETLVVPE